MNNLRPFQIVILGIFIAFALGGILFVSVYQGGIFEDVKPYGESVVIWGTLDEVGMKSITDTISASDKDFVVVTYIQKDPMSFESELLNAIAEGNSPDMIIISHEMLISHRAKLLSLSYETYPERTFRDTYIDGADIFMRPDGIYGIPFAVDPMVLYWNRDMFGSAGLPNPPRTWEEIVSVTMPALRKFDASQEITESAIAFGEYVNVTHAKDILSLLFLQSGTNIVEESLGSYAITLGQAASNGLPPAEAVLSFYTQFAIPTSPNYTWNRSQRSDRLEFLSGHLGMYFGMGTEVNDFERENPNLNFDMTSVPQGAGANVLRNYGDIYAFAFLRSSENPAGAYQAALRLSDVSQSEAYELNFGLAPVHRSKIAEGTTNPYSTILYRSALITRGWLDPNPRATETIFKETIEDVTSGRERVKSAITVATGRLQLLFK